MSQLLWVLIAIQITMGAFDTFYHHEMTERLAWRPSQRYELQLHGARSLIYCFLFLVLGWAEVHGIWAMLIMAILLAEVVITLLDFVEEDMSRKLPASERVNHTLLALNYGAILALLLPILFAWAQNDTAIVFTSHGYWSLFATASAIGAAPFGLRDLAAARRATRLVCGPAAPLMERLAPGQTILVTGATGFIGRRLVEGLAGAGHQVIALVRDPAGVEKLPTPITLVTSLDQIPSETRIHAIVNLAGEPIGNGLGTPAKRRRIVASRVDTTGDLVRLIARLNLRPGVLVSASAVGWYGLRQDETLTEGTEGKACFSHALCDAWEKAASEAEQYGVRVVRLRIGLVLGTEGGVLSRMLTPFEFGLGGPIGSGAQWMSWIERDDLVRLIAYAIGKPDLSGPVNATAPMPVSNAAFTRELGRGLRRPAILRVPAGLLHRLAGDFADELLLSGQRVLPGKALASGFAFRHETLRSAFKAILGSS